jgi:transcriptional regulator with XRE-family HTH domain
MWVITHVIKPNTMQNLLLLHLRGQHKLTARKIEQATGIPAANYMEYEQGIMPIPDTELDLLCTLFKVKWIHLRNLLRSTGLLLSLKRHFGSEG